MLFLEPEQLYVSKKEKKRKGLAEVKSLLAWRSGWCMVFQSSTLRCAVTVFMQRQKAVFCRVVAILPWLIQSGLSTSPSPSLLKCQGKRERTGIWVCSQHHYGFGTVCSFSSFCSTEEQFEDSERGAQCSAGQRIIYKLLLTLPCEWPCDLMKRAYHWTASITSFWILSKGNVILFLFYSHAPLTILC